MLTKRTKSGIKAIIPPDGFAEYWRSKREKKINNTSVNFDDLLKDPQEIISPNKDKDA